MNTRISLGLVFLFSVLVSSKVLGEEVVINSEFNQSYSRWAQGLNSDHSQLPDPVDAVWLLVTRDDADALHISEYIVKVGDIPPIDPTDGEPLPIPDPVYPVSDDPNLITLDNRPVDGTLIQASDDPTFATYDVVELLDVVDGIQDGIIIPMIYGRSQGDDVQMWYYHGRTFTPEPIPSTDPNLITVENQPPLYTTIQVSNSPTFEPYVTGIFLGIGDAGSIVGEDVDGEITYLYGRTIVEDPIDPIDPPVVLCYTDVATQAQIRGLLLQLRNLVNQADVAAAMRSVADLYGKVDEVNGELDVLGCLNNE